MGCIQSETGAPQANELKNASTITVANLNYCGIMNSPFQFYCQDFLTELKDISNQFLALLPRYFPSFNKSSFKWEMGKIDLKFRNRYSPMFDLKAGIENNRFMSEETFGKKWQEVFKVQMPKLKVQYKEEQKEVTKKYDILMYHTLLMYVFKAVNIKDAQNKSVDKYIAKLKPLFELSFLDQKKKGEKVRKNFQKLNADIFFFQEYSEGFYETLKKGNQYYMAHDESKDTMIIAKKKSFKEKKDRDVFFKKFLDQQLQVKLNWAERSSFLVVDSYFCISAHLSSKAQKNLPQIKEMRQTLLTLKSRIPDYEIILGGDLNSFLEPFSEEINMYPRDNKEMTTVKKRTSTQGQFNKAEKVVCESKDKIISTLKILQGKTMYITGAKPSSDNLVPTDQHPFDHFVVVAVLQKKNQ